MKFHPRFVVFLFGHAEQDFAVTALIYPIFGNDRVSSGKLVIRKRKLTIKTSLRA